MERLGQTVKKHFEHFIRISFVYTRNSSSTASERLTLEFSRRERRSLPSPFTAQLVVVVSFFVVYLKKCCLHIMTLSVCRLQNTQHNFDTYSKLLTGRRLLKSLIPAFLKRGPTNASFHMVGKCPPNKENFKILVISGQTYFFVRDLNIGNIYDSLALGSSGTASFPAMRVQSMS